jgi:hypothetical protein
LDLLFLPQGGRALASPPRHQRLDRQLRYEPWRSYDGLASEHA